MIMIFDEDFNFIDGERLSDSEILDVDNTIRGFLGIKEFSQIIKVGDQLDGFECRGFVLERGQYFVLLLKLVSEMLADGAIVKKANLLGLESMDPTIEIDNDEFIAHCVVQFKIWLSNNELEIY